MTWLAETPGAVVSAHLAMLERLEGEEALRGVGVALAGRAIRIRPWTVNERLRAWRAAASRGGAGVRRTELSRAELASHGIGVRRVKPKARKES